MEKFSKLLESIIFSPSKNKKILLLKDYLRQTQNPDRGYAISVLTGKLKFKSIRNVDLKNMIRSKVDPYLFDLSYDYVGDMAETISLIWPLNKKKNLPSLTNFIKFISQNRKAEVLNFLSDVLDSSNQTERWSIIKLITGGLRIGVSERMVKLSLSVYGNKEIESIEKIWHGLSPPYENLFNWLENKQKKPKINFLKIFHPMMLSHPIDEKSDFANLKPEEFSAEWKWDGIRVQIVIASDETRIFSRNGDDISHSFPDLKFFTKTNVVVDGELLVGKNCIPSSFNDLQQRLNRKKVSKKHTELYPVFIKLYDILFHNNMDLRNLSFIKRRNFLEKWFILNKQERLDLSEIISFKNWKKLKELKHKFTDSKFGFEGIMLKKKTSPYLMGRPKGMWYKWKRNPKYIDAILMYAQRGHGKRSSYYSDFTFGVWKENNLVPIGKAYSGFTNQELNKLDQFVRKKTINRFGPVREVEKKVIFEVAFDSITKSSRHKSGIALRFPRISRIRYDKPINEVENLDTILKIYKLNY